jgi:hypothetical protein
MKKYTEFKTDTNKPLSNDIEKLDDILDTEGSKKLIGSWEIVSIVDISTKEPINEGLQPLIINAEVGNREIKRGEFIYITAQIKKPGQSTLYHHSQMGVIKVRIVDIYNTMTILNNL